MKRRTWIWPVAAVVLLAAAAWLMSGDEMAPPRTAPEVTFPRAPDTASRNRAVERRTLPPPPFVTPDAGVVAAPPATPARDPLFAALPGGENDTAVVLEVNAVRHSRLGELMVDCLTSRDDGALLSQMRDGGLDVLTDVDRFAFGDDTIVITGHFERAQWESLLRADGPSTPYGESGRLVQRTNESGRSLGAAASWGSELLVIGKSEEAVKLAIDRLEGRAPAGPPAIAEEDAYGDLYGKLSTQDLARALASQNPQLAALLEQATRQVKLNVDASGDLAIVADFEGQNAERLEELRKMMGGALSLLRMQAQGQADGGNLADLLDFTRLQKDRDGEGFTMELAVPAELIEQRLKACVEENRRKRGIDL